MCILGLNSFQGFDVTVLEGSPDDVGIRGNETCFPFFYFLWKRESGFCDAKKFHEFVRTQLNRHNLKLNMNHMMILPLMLLLIDQNGYKTMMLL